MRTIVNEKKNQLKIKFMSIESKSKILIKSCMVERKKIAVRVLKTSTKL